MTVGMDVLEPKLSLERYAAITALIDGVTPRDEVLERAALAPFEWGDEQGKWLLLLAVEARHERRDKLDTFNRTLVGFLELVEAGEQEQLWPVAKGEREVPSPAPLLAAAPTEAAPVSVSPVSVSPPSVSAPPASQAPARVSPSAAPRVASSLPPAGPSVWAAAAPAAAAPFTPTETFDGGGMDVTLDAALPFEQPPQSARGTQAALPVVALTPEVVLSNASSETLDDASAPLTRGAATALPFIDRMLSTVVRDPAAAGHGEVAVLPFEASSSKAKAAAGGLPFGSRASAKPRRNKNDEALPFQGRQRSRAGLPFAPAPTPEADSEDDKAVDDGPARDALTGTMVASQGVFDGIGGEPSLTLEQFASLKAEMDAEPENRQKILQRYGLSLSDQQRELLAWAGKLLKDAELSERYNAKLAEFRAYLKHQRDGG